MSVVEYKLLGNIFLITAVAFFGLALPGYAIARRMWPESDWNRGGSVSTSVIHWIDLIIAGGLVGLFYIAYQGIPAAYESGEMSNINTAKVWSSALGNLVFAMLVPLAMAWRVNLKEFFGLRWLDWKAVFWIAPLFVLAFIALTVIIQFTGWTDWVSRNFGGGEQALVKSIKATGDVSLLVALTFSAVVVAPIAEEIIFRGYLYPIVKQFSDRWFAALFTGLLFGVIHFNLLSLPTLALMGITLVVVYEMTGSLWSVIACHAAFNGFQMALMFAQRMSGQPISP